VSKNVANKVAYLNGFYVLYYEIFITSRFLLHVKYGLYSGDTGYR